MNTRSATPLDGFVLSSLCMDVQRLHGEHYPRIFKMPESEGFAVSFFEQMLADPSVHTFITEENEKVVGYIVASGAISRK